MNLENGGRMEKETRRGVQRSMESGDDTKEVKTMAKDPVCGMDVDEKKAAATATYKGQDYYFCAEACKRAFEKDPQKYTD